MPLYLTERLADASSDFFHLTLALTAEERTRSRHYFQTEDQQGVHLALPRGTTLQHGDVLRSEAGDILVRVIAKPEPVMTVTADTPLGLLRAAYHLGNRHVLLEVTTDHLRLLPDAVLRAMLEQLGMQVVEAVAPFQPEGGAYATTYHQTHESSHEHA